MRTFSLLVMMVISIAIVDPVSADDNFRIQISRTRTRAEVSDPWKFDDYRYRIESRRRDALALRREYNAAKGPHIYRTAIVVPLPFTPLIGIETGWVRQPPIIPNFRRNILIRNSSLVKPVYRQWTD